MKKTLATTTALTLCAASAHAVGLDRSGQRIGILFETGNHLEFSAGYADPTLEGNALAVFGGGASGNVAGGFSIFSLGFKGDINDKLSYAVIGDEPYGSDIFYPNNPATSILGGTGATVDSVALTALLRYKFSERWSVHGGLRYQEVDSVVTLGGLAFNSPATPFVPSGVNGYRAVFDSDGDVGVVIGGAFEIPDIALRVAVTYNSGTTHDLPTTETIRGTQISIPGATSEVDTPESLNIAFQTGIAPDTLLFGALRYARYSDTVLLADGFSSLTGGTPLTDLEDGLDFELGVGRRFSDKWSGSVSAGFSTVGDDDLISPLAPNNGSQFIAVGAKYDVNDKFAISGGVRYTSLGDATSAPGGNGVARFEGNSAVSAGLRFAFKF